MATIEEAIPAMIGTMPAVSALVGNKVFPVGTRQDVGAPYITFQQISGEGVRSLKGSSGIEHPRFQFNCWDQTLLGAASVADALRAAIDGWAGTAAGVVIRRVIAIDRGHLSSEGTGNKGVRVDFRIWHERSLP